MRTGRDRRRQTMIGAAAILVAFVAAVGVAMISIGDRPGFVRAVGFATLFSLPSSLVGWILARRRPSGAAQAIIGPLAAIVVRILPPLAALGFLSSESGRALREAGAGPLIVGFYLVLLVTDILLHIMMGRPQTIASPPDPSH